MLQFTWKGKPCTIAEATANKAHRYIHIHLQQSFSCTSLSTSQQFFQPLLCISPLSLHSSRPPVVPAISLCTSQQSVHPPLYIPASFHLSTFQQSFQLPLSLHSSSRSSHLSTFLQSFQPLLYILQPPPSLYPSSRSSHFSI